MKKCGVIFTEKYPFCKYCTTFFVRLVQEKNNVTVKVFELLQIKLREEIRYSPFPI